MSGIANVDPNRFAHGTRGRYVGGKCRCAPCREANRLYYHKRQAEIRAAIADVVAGPPAEPKPRTWRPRGGGPARTRVYKNGCPGAPQLGGCPWQSFLRKDSKGGLCIPCRSTLVMNPLVLVGRARSHIRRLGRAGVGYKSVADAAGVSRTICADVLAGRRKHIRKATEAAVLGVTKDAIADGAQVDAGPTWKILDALLARGFTKTFLAAQLGSSGNPPALQIKRARCLASTALAVAKLGRRLADEHPPAPPIQRDSAWGPPDDGGLRKHLTCRGRGCPSCAGQGWRRG